MTKTLCAPFGCASPSRADARREKLIQVARDLFAGHGFHNTGIAQIAKESGVLVGQIYRDFASKEEIVAAIVERDLNEFLVDSDLRCAIGRRDAGDVRRWIRDFIDGGRKPDGGRLVAEIMAESSRNVRIAAILQSCRTRIRDSILDSLEVLIPDPAKAERRALLADTILTISTGLFHHRLAQAEPIHPALIASLQALIDQEIDTLAAA